MPEPRTERTPVVPPSAGEIRISRLESGTTVAWEGDRARGTVEPAISGGDVPPHDQRPLGDRPSLPVTPRELRRASDALGGLLRLRAATAAPRRPRRA